MSCRSYLDLGNAEKAAVAARSVLQALGKTNEVRVIGGKTSVSAARVVILSADEKDARVLLQDIRFSYPDAWFGQCAGTGNRQRRFVSGGREATSFWAPRRTSKNCVCPVTKEA